MTSSSLTALVMSWLSSAPFLWWRPRSHWAIWGYGNQSILMNLSSANHHQMTVLHTSLVGQDVVGRDVFQKVIHLSFSTWDTFATCTSIIQSVDIERARLPYLDLVDIPLEIRGQFDEGRVDMLRLSGQRIHRQLNEDIIVNSINICSSAQITIPDATVPWTGDSWVHRERQWWRKERPPSEIGQPLIIMTSHHAHLPHTSLPVLSTPLNLKVCSPAFNPITPIDLFFPFLITHGSTPPFPLRCSIWKKIDEMMGGGLR